MAIRLTRRRSLSIVSRCSAAGDTDTRTTSQTSLARPTRIPSSVRRILVAGVSCLRCHFPAAQVRLSTVEGLDRLESGRSRQVLRRGARAPRARTGPTSHSAPGWAKLSGGRSSAIRATPPHLKNGSRSPASLAKPMPTRKTVNSPIRDRRHEPSLSEYMKTTINQLGWWALSRTSAKTWRSTVASLLLDSRE